jgi:pentose-5-phosphate-3-epimerase
MLQGYGDTVLWAETLEKELTKVRKHSAMLQSKLDGAINVDGSIPCSSSPQAYG